MKKTELNDETRYIFGRPGFAVMPIVHLLRACGHKIKTKMEDEQAAAIHFMLNIYEEHGDKWREKMDELVEVMVEEQKRKEKNK